MPPTSRSYGSRRSLALPLQSGLLVLQWPCQRHGTLSLQDLRPGLANRCSHEDTTSSPMTTFVCQTTSTRKCTHTCGILHCPCMSANLLIVSLSHQPVHRPRELVADARSIQPGHRYIFTDLYTDNVLPLCNNGRNAHTT